MRYSFSFELIHVFYWRFSMFDIFLINLFSSGDVLRLADPVLLTGFFNLAILFINLKKKVLLLYYIRQLLYDNYNYITYDNYYTTSTIIIRQVQNNNTSTIIIQVQLLYDKYKIIIRQVQNNNTSTIIIQVQLLYDKYKIIIRQVQ